MSRPAAIPLAFVLLLWLAAPAAAQSEIDYRVSFPAPEHHWMQVEVTFRQLGDAPLDVQMSRASPGRYAVHEFAKNVFLLEAWDGRGRRLTPVRTGPDGWRLTEHDGTVRVSYRIFGDHVDGTYLAIDTTHAHLNMPAAFLWADRLSARPVRITFVPPDDAHWTAATQLFPTADPWTFTAPNLQYFLDSPVELASLTGASFTVDNPGGSPARFRLFVHGEATQADVDALAVLVRRLVQEQQAVFGALPDFEPGHYTFLLDYVPWADTDAMEHRNSTSISHPAVSLATPGGRLAALGSISHELFHVWNVERIRPADLEPFDFSRPNVSCCLWLAEGFTQYYGALTLLRAGLSNSVPLGPVVSLLLSPGRTIRSAIEMSEHAPFADAGLSNDVHDRSRTFLSYYTGGAAIALGLDLSIRDRTEGRLTLDDYMRQLWERYGSLPAPQPGLVARPYTLADLRRELGDLLQDQAFAEDYFHRYIEGREVPDYERLLGLAGYRLQRVAPERGWAGHLQVQQTARGLLVGGGTGALTAFETPAYSAGVDSGDVIVTIDGQPATLETWAALAGRAPGARVDLVLERRDRRRVTTTLVVAADPTLQIVPAETSGALSDAQRRFRADWLGSSVR